VGTLRNRTGRVVSVHCKLMQSASDELAGLAGGSASLNESEWAMLGRSVEVRLEDRPPPSLDEPEWRREDQLIRALDQRSTESHPLQDPKFPYRVMLMVDGKERKPVFRGNECYVPVSKGEEYEIWIENRSGGPVLTRLLIDGLNTLPEKDTTKGISTYIVGKRVNLDEARFWILDPFDLKTERKIWAIRGFVTETGAQGKLRKFTVVDADQSLAARRQFTDQIGLITAAFYAPGSKPRGSGIGQYGTEAGDEQDEEILEQGGYRIGDMRGVVHLRYVDPSTL
jgi:hypothetical protein